MKTFLIALALICATCHAGKFKRLTSAIQEARFGEDIAILSGAHSFVDERGDTQTIKDRFMLAEIQKARFYLIREMMNCGFSRVAAESFPLSTAKEPYQPKKKARKRPLGVNFFMDLFGSEHPDEIIVLGGHYDTPGHRLPGANDNGSGVAAVLEVARAFKDTGIRPKRTIRFALFDAEELLNYEGSEYHLDQALLRGENIVGLVNVDMITHAPEAINYLGYDAKAFPLLEPLVEKVNQKADVGFILDHWPRYQSDHRPGRYRGIPSLSFFEDPRDAKGKGLPYDPNNHSRKDTFDQVNISYGTRATKVIAGLTLKMANSSDVWENAESSHLREKAFRRAKRRYGGYLTSCVDRIAYWK